MIVGITKPIDPKSKEGDPLNPFYVGIKLSSKSNVVYLMKPDGSKHCNFSRPNSFYGSR